MVSSRLSCRGVAAAIVLFACAAFAAKQYTAPRADPAKTYPARDEHPDEHVTIAADPYDTPDKEAQVFALKYSERGLMPVFLIISNESDQPLQLLDMKAEMVTVDRTKITAATSDDLYRRMSHLKRRGDEPQKVPIPLPVPLPRRKAQAGLGKEGEIEVSEAPFKARAVEPHGTQAGFLFFDVGGIDHPLAGAHLYITGVKTSDGKELMYFDIPLEKYLSYQP